MVNLAPPTLMLITLILLCFSGAGVKALHLLSADPAEQPQYSRTAVDIVWSCFATVISCVWVSIHPNVPGPNESASAIAFRRLKICVLALVTPELVTAWAIRQRVVAQNVAKKYRYCVLVPYKFA